MPQQVVVVQIQAVAVAVLVRQTYQELLEAVVLE
jgi:hypothetical protein